MRGRHNRGRRRPKNEGGSGNIQQSKKNLKDVGYNPNDPDWARERALDKLIAQQGHDKTSETLKTTIRNNSKLTEDEISAIRTDAAQVFNKRQLRQRKFITAQDAAKLIRPNYDKVD